MTRIVEGDAGKSICKEAEKVKPIAVVMGTRGRSLMQRYVSFSLTLLLSYYTSLFFCRIYCFILHFVPFLLHVFSVLQGSVSEYCFHNCKAAPVIIVPGIGMKSKFLFMSSFFFFLFINGSRQWDLNEFIKRNSGSWGRISGSFGKEINTFTKNYLSTKLCLELVNRSGGSGYTRWLCAQIDHFPSSFVHYACCI